MNSLRRKATRVVGAAEITTLHRALTTADEVRSYLKAREETLGVGSRGTSHLGVDGLEPIALGEFLWRSRAQLRAVEAIGWMYKNLHIGWPIDKVEKSDSKKASLIGMVDRMKSYLAAREEASGREQKATFRQGLTGPRLLRPANPEPWPRRRLQEEARHVVSGSPWRFDAGSPRIFAGKAGARQPRLLLPACGRWPAPIAGWCPIPWGPTLLMAQQQEE